MDSNWHTRMNQEPVHIDEYTELRHVLDKAEEKLYGADIMILPEGGSDLLIERLKCKRCGRFVCPPHDREVRQKRRESMVRVPMNDEQWSPYFPRRVALAIANELKVVV